MRSGLWKVAAALILILVVFVACGPTPGETGTSADSGPHPAAPGSADGGQAPREDGLFRIVTTTTQATDLAGILTAGVSDVEVTGLMGPGVDPHLYQPAEGDIAAMNRANMVVYSGLHLEGQFDSVFDALSEQEVEIYSLSRAVKDAGFIIGAFDEAMAQVGTDDPHFWFDPRNWEVTTRDLAETLAEVDPENAAAYQANAEKYIEGLQLLYDWADEGIRSVPG